MPLVAPTGGRRITVDSRGHIDGLHPDGVPTPVVTWKAQNTWPDLAGASISVRNQLNEPGSPNATITVDPAFPLPSGRSFNGENLTHGGTADAGVTRFIATRNSIATPMPYLLALPAVSSEAADNLAPTIPHIISVTRVGGANRVLIQQGSDPHPAGIQAKGLKEILLEHALDLGSFSQIQAIPSGGPGLTPVFSLKTIGSHDSTPSANQIGADVSITAEVIGEIWGTADNCAFWAAQFSGNLDLLVTIPNYANPGFDWTKPCIMLREDLDPDSKMLMITAFTPAGARGIKLERRAVKGGVATGGTLIAGANANAPVRLWLNKTGDLLTGRWLNGADFQAIDPAFTLPFATVYWAGLALGQTGGNIVTVNFTQFTHQNLANLTHDHVIASAGSHRYRARQGDLQT